MPGRLIVRDLPVPTADVTVQISRISTNEELCMSQYSEILKGNDLELKTVIGPDMIIELTLSPLHRRGRYATVVHLELRLSSDAAFGQDTILLRNYATAGVLKECSSSYGDSPTL